MTDSREVSRQSLRAYPIQLVQVYCLSVTGERRDRSTDDPSEQQLSVELKSTPLSDDHLAFECLLVVSAIAPVLEDATATLSVGVHGTFAAEQPMSDDLYRRFIESTPLVQLWPYARAYLGSIGSLLGIDLPVLPLIDAFAPVEAGEQPPDQG